MVTCDTIFPVRIKFFFIFEFAILSAFSLITDDGKITNDVATTPSYSETRGQIENTPTNNGSSLVFSDHAKLVLNSEDLEKSAKVMINRTKREKMKEISFSNTTLFLLPTNATREMPEDKSTTITPSASSNLSEGLADPTFTKRESLIDFNKPLHEGGNITSSTAIPFHMPFGGTIEKNQLTQNDSKEDAISQGLNKRKELNPVSDDSILSNKRTVLNEIEISNKSMVDENWKMSEVRDVVASLRNVSKVHVMETNQNNTVGEITNKTASRESVKIIPFAAAISSSFTNSSVDQNTTHRQGKEFISEETLMESRNYNYEPGYPTYNQQPTGSGEDNYNVQTFATITRDFWPNYQQEVATYPTITTAKTPRAPQFPVSPNRWRFPLWYRQKLRGTYPKDEPSFYDYLEDGDPSALESMSMHRWSPPASGPAAAGSNANPVRSEFHRYHEGGGYDYSPHYDFAHVHEHAGHESHDTGYKMDYTKLGLLLLLKLAIAKLKALGALQILLLLLLKAKLLLAMMALKFFMVMKAMKLLKYLILPMLLSSLLPMLLMGPLSLLSALLPLLMNLQVPPEDPEPPPDLPDEPEMPPDMMPEEMKRKKKHKSRGLENIQRVLRSEDCLQRTACELAAKRQLSLVPIIVSWSLECLSKMVPIPMVKAYSKAYSEGRQKGRAAPGCAAKYKCNFFDRNRS